MNFVNLDLIFLDFYDIYDTCKNCWLNCLRLKIIYGRLCIIGKRENRGKKGSLPNVNVFIIFLVHNKYNDCIIIILGFGKN